MNGREDTTRVPIDKQSPDAYWAQVEASKVVRKTAEAAGLPRTLVELINIRISQMNGCAFCLHVHVRAAHRAGETPQRISVLPAWRDTTLFSAKERAALTLAESLTTLPDPRTQDQDYADARQHLSPLEISAVSWIAITMNAFNRISIISPPSGPTGSSSKRQPMRTRRSTMSTSTVRDNPAESRYEIYDGEHLAGFTTYKLSRDRISFIHTEIAPEFGGRGLARQLVTEELDDARRRQLAVLPFCPFVRKIIAQSPDTYLDLVPHTHRDRFGLTDLQA